MFLHVFAFGGHEELEQFLVGDQGVALLSRIQMAVFRHASHPDLEELPADTPLGNAHHGGDFEELERLDEGEVLHVGQDGFVEVVVGLADLLTG